MIIELILVLAIAAIIIVMGLNYYRNAVRAMQLNLVNHDVLVIHHALEDFYEMLPCNTAGVLQQAVNTDVISQLPGVPMSRPPYVNQYGAFILDNHVVNSQQKPIYTLEIRADAQHWDYLPMVSSGSQVSRELFQQQQNSALLGVGVYSHAYCAR